MSLSARIAIRFLLMAVLISSVATVALRQNAIARLRLEHETLAGETEEAARLAEENKGIPALREMADEAKQLRDANRDLPKLRNDARQLRRQADEFSKLLAAHQNLTNQLAKAAGQGTASFPDGFIPAQKMIDAGTETPEAALQTAFWAIRQGNRQRALQVVDPNTAAKMTGELEEEFQKKSTEFAGMFAGYQVLEKQEKSSDEVTFTIILGTEDQPTHIRIIRVGGEWKMVN